jgi:hypothetical protein
MIVIALLLLCSGVFLCGYSTGLRKATKDMREILEADDERQRGL